MPTHTPGAGRFWALATAITLLCLTVSCGTGETATRTDPVAEAPPSPTGAPAAAGRVSLEATPGPTPAPTSTPAPIPPTPTATTGPSGIPPSPTTEPSPTATPRVTGATTEPEPGAAEQHPYEERVVRFKTKDGVNIVATLYDAGGDLAAILGHMNADGARTRASWASFGRHLAGQGITALALDFRGFGESVAQASYSKLPLDLQGAMRFLRGEGYERFVCMGASMGGVACFDSALQGHAWDGLAIIAAPITGTAEELASLTMPKLLASEQGEPADMLALQKVFVALPEPKTLQKYPVEAHGTFIFATEYGDDFRTLLTGFVAGIRAQSGEPAAAEPTPAPAVEITRDIAYVQGGHGQQVLDVYLPAGLEAPLPVLLLVHGGGEDKTSLARMATGYAKEGYAVASMDYRDSRSATYPAPVEDAFCAWAWMQASAGDYGFDPDRIVALGHSLGGTLVAMLAAVDDPARFLAGCPHQLSAGAGLQGAVAFTGIFDYPAAARDRDLQSYASGYLGAAQGDAPELWAEASPISWIDGSEPPVLLVHGEGDSNIPPGQSEEFAAALAAAGVDVELLLIPKASHEAIKYHVDALQALDSFLTDLR